MAVRILLILSYTIDLDGAEFTFVHYVQQMLDGKELYLNPEAYPFSATIYTPLYLEIVSAICTLFQFDFIHDIRNIYITGRLVSFLFVLLCLWYIDKFVRKQSGGLLLRTGSMAVFLILVTGHMFAFRPDSMKIAFFLLFLYHYTEYFLRTPSAKNAALAVLFSLLSVMAKQDAIIYILLVQGIHLLLNRKLTVLTFLAGSCLGFVLLFAWMRFYYGPFFLTSVIEFNVQVISNVQQSYNLLVIIFNSIRLLPIYLLFVYGLFTYRKHPNYLLIKTLCFSGIAAALISTVFLFRPGGYLNYTYELIVISLFLLMTLFAAKLLSKRWLTILTVYFTFIFLIDIAINNYSVYPSKERKKKEDFFAYYELRKKTALLLEQQESIFSPVPELSIFLADKNVIYGHEYHLDRLIYAHLGLHTNSRLLFSPSTEYDAYFRSGQVKYILANNNTECRLLIQKEYPYYKNPQVIDGFVLYTFQTGKD